MNFIEIAIGAAAILYAAASVYFRIKSPALFKKLEPMKRIYGAKPGLALHVLLYTLIPCIFGVVLVLEGFHATDIVIDTILAPFRR